MNYFITFRTYGTWLHGDERGAVDKQHNGVGQEVLPPHRGLERAMLQALQHDKVLLDAACRACVERTIREVARYRGWEIRTLSVQTNHVHVVVNADAKPEKVMSDFKAYATRRLREAQLTPFKGDVWSSHGSTRYLKTPESIRSACQYVAENQADLSNCP